MKQITIIIQLSLVGLFSLSQLNAQKLDYDKELNIIFYDIYLKSGQDTRMAEYYSVDKINIDVICHFATKFLSLSQRSKKAFLDASVDALFSKGKLKEQEHRALKDIHSLLSEEEYLTFWKGISTLNNQIDKSELVANICNYIDAIAQASGFNSLKDMIEINQESIEEMSKNPLGISIEEGMYGEHKEKYNGWLLEIEDILCPPTIGGKQAELVNHMKGGKKKNKMAKIAYLSSVVSGAIAATNELAGYGLEIGSKSISIVAGGIGCTIGLNQLACGSADNNCTKTEGSFMDLCAGLSTEECMKRFYSNRVR